MTEPWTDDSYVGKYLGRHEYAVDETAIERYVQGTRDDHPWYRGDSPFGGAVAPALLLHSEQYAFRLRDWYLPKLYGNLHIRQEWDLFRAVPVGETLSTHGMIIDRYIKRDRDVVVNEVSIFNEGGVMVSRLRCHQSFLLDVDPNATVVDKGTAKVRRDEAVVERLEELEPVEKVVDLDLCMAFSGPRKNYHNDREEAKKLGFPDVVVQGTMSTTFISEMMTRRFGKGWLEGGRMGVNLINVLWGGEPVTARGFIREYLPEGPRRRAVVEVWTEKPDGTKTMAGQCSAVVE
jgi:hypothetical protein